MINTPDIKSCVDKIYAIIFYNSYRTGDIWDIFNIYDHILGQGELNLVIYIQYARQKLSLSAVL